MMPMVALDDGTRVHCLVKSEAIVLDNHVEGYFEYGVHINDGVAGRSADQQMDLERELPLATGIIDAATFSRSLKALHYDGPVTVEPFNEELNALSADDAAACTATAARAMLALA